MTVTGTYEGVARVAVIGAGTIGASWAAYFLSRGLEVSASDPAPGAADGVAPLHRQGVAGAADARARRGCRPRPGQLRAPILVRPPRAPGSCRRAGRTGWRPSRRCFEQVGAVLGPEVIIASSSSNLMPSVIQARCPHPERVVVGHPFNPPHLIPLVEVCGGAQTSPEVVDRAVRFYRAIGKHPIRLNKEMPGHVSNRLQAAVWREAAYLVEQGVVNVADVDAAVAKGPGIRWALMGPALTHHLGGGAGGLRYLWQNFGPAILWPHLGAQGGTARRCSTNWSRGWSRRLGGRSMEEWARWRDEKLVAMLQQLEADEPIGEVLAMKSWFRAALLAGGLALSAIGAEAAEIRVLTAGAFRPVLDELDPGFEARSGNKVKVETDTAGGVAARIERGDAFDIAVLTPATAQNPERDGRIILVTPVASVGHRPGGADGGAEAGHLERCRAQGDAAGRAIRRHGRSGVRRVERHLPGQDVRAAGDRGSDEAEAGANARRPSGRAGRRAATRCSPSAASERAAGGVRRNPGRPDTRRSCRAGPFMSPG